MKSWRERSATVVTHFLVFRATKAESTPNALQVFGVFLRPAHHNRDEPTRQEAAAGQRTQLTRLLIPAWQELPQRPYQAVTSVRDLRLIPTLLSKSAGGAGSNPGCAIN